MYYNHEGYPDPTAGAALAKIEREEREKKRKRMNQKEFYHSRAWARARDAYIRKRIALDSGVCEVCRQELGLVVHHFRVWLDDNNCNDPGISLSESNFRYECQVCHNKEKDPRRKAAGRVIYSPDGEVTVCEK